jgi:hypothetical protein
MACTQSFMKAVTWCKSSGEGATHAELIIPYDRIRRVGIILEVYLQCSKPNHCFCDRTHLAMQMLHKRYGHGVSGVNAYKQIVSISCFSKEGNSY